MAKYGNDVATFNASTNFCEIGKCDSIAFFIVAAEMLNQVAVDAIYSATYLENYLDSVENLPNDLQRQISRMRQLDVDFQGSLAVQPFVS